MRLIRVFPRRTSLTPNDMVAGMFLFGESLNDEQLAHLDQLQRFQAIARLQLSKVIAELESLLRQNTAQGTTDFDAFAEDVLEWLEAAQKEVKE